METDYMRNPGNPKRTTEANQKRTQAVIDAYNKKKLLLECWEEMPMAVQCREHDYILTLRHRIRTLRQMILHRSDPNATI